MSGRTYLKPPWGQRHIGNRLAPFFRPSLIPKLTVVGRRTGRPRTTPVVVLEHQGQRYLVSYRGESDWARNLRAAGRGQLRRRRQVEEIAVVEVPVAQRGPIMQAYRERFDGMRRCRASSTRSPIPPTILCSGSSRRIAERKAHRGPDPPLPPLGAWGICTARLRIPSGTLEHRSAPARHPA